MELAEFELIDVILAAVVGTIIMVVFCLLARKSKSRDEDAIKFGGLVGFFVYRLARRIGITRGITRTFCFVTRPDRLSSKKRIKEIREGWRKESDECLLRAATKDINEYPSEVQAIIHEEAIKRGLMSDEQNNKYANR